MKTRILALALVFALTLTAVSAINMAYAPCGGGGGYGGGTSTTPLSDFEKYTLNRAIDEERMAKAVYEKVVATFGPISPFPRIIKDEQCHINRVTKLLTAYGLPIPPDRWTGNVTLEFTSKQQACEVGAQAEIDNAAFYCSVIPQITHEDIISAFTMLGDVSQYRHLPAFQYWATIYASLGE